ncbi:hypothetical protein DFH06DRAFT_273260 [Mycena polygramma]|nr:hypothetical protein DFH06DRAFT_273260 [Mycena polygramma]
MERRCVAFLVCRSVFPVHLGPMGINPCLCLSFTLHIIQSVAPPMYPFSVLSSLISDELFARVVYFPGPSLLGWSLLYSNPRTHCSSCSALLYLIPLITIPHKLSVAQYHHVHHPTLSVSCNGNEMGLQIGLLLHNVTKEIHKLTASSRCVQINMGIELFLPAN